MKTRARTDPVAPGAAASTPSSRVRRTAFAECRGFSPAAYRGAAARTTLAAPKIYFEPCSSRRQVRGDRLLWYESARIDNRNAHRPPDPADDNGTHGFALRSRLSWRRPPYIETIRGTRAIRVIRQPHAAERTAGRAAHAPARGARYPGWASRRRRIRQRQCWFAP